ncbi:4Fe-4S dicluster domain-containing protein [Fontisphaera persica]|uniref:4Fe-4S dicluster domain-containing protein n=1 Tax=Fontisphaera persica TaxID=2974023 RepID=UPI0024BF34F4|nr:4Fe-4S dicluster domain-containing protein [Fontisphaera persica]WCJ61009.1 4Fe-4S dicluster domain-containing protein [Fontisphaera persica]
MSLVEQVRQAGVVGAGGGGFPTHVKLSAKADTVIANGAECEPLLHKDAVVMEEWAQEMRDGMLLAMEAVGAQTGVIGIKAKKKKAIEAVTRAIAGTPLRLELLGDYYPSGDEYDLVYTVTGRLIPPQGIPLNVGVVVNNVETFVNVARAARGQPVTHKMVTLAGAVREPCTLVVPVGVTWRECLEAAGGATTAEPVLCIGGLMMGQTTLDLDTPVTKTATGVVVLPREHHIIQRKLNPQPRMAQIGKSACDQCRYCTEFCPRYLLGYAVEPHQVMRSLAFTATGAEYWNQWAALCCSCGLCTLYACPEELYPKEACDDAKAAMRRANQKWSGKMEVQVHPLREGRRVPIQALTRKLHVQEYDVPAPLREWKGRPRELHLLLKQHAGAPAQPQVKVGDTVKAGQIIAAPAPNALGATLHAPLAGRVAAVTPERISLAVL